MADDRMRISESMRFEVASGDWRWLTEDSALQVSQECSRVLNILKGEESATSLGKLFCCLTTLTIKIKKLSLMNKRKFTCYPFACSSLSGPTIGNDPIRCSCTGMAASSPVYP